MSAREPGYYRDILERILKENDREEDKILHKRKINRQWRNVVILMKPHISELVRQIEILISNMTDNPNNFLDKSAVERYEWWSGETDPMPPDPDEDLDDLIDEYRRLITRLQTNELTIHTLYDILEASRYYDESLNIDDQNVVDVFNRVLGHELTTSIKNIHLTS